MTGSSKKTNIISTTTNQNVGLQGDKSVGVSGSNLSFGAKAAYGGNLYDVSNLGQGAHVNIMTTDPEAFETVRQVAAASYNTTTKMLETVSATNDKYAELAGAAIVGANDIVRNATPTQAAELVNAMQSKPSDYTIPIMLAVAAFGAILLVRQFR